MGKAVQMFCSGDWDPKRVPQGTENLDSLLDAAPSHLPRRPQRCFTGENCYLNKGLPFVLHISSYLGGCIILDISSPKFCNLWLCSYASAWISPYPHSYLHTLTHDFHCR